MDREDGNSGGQAATAFSRRRIDGDTFERMVCDNCGFVRYDNPRIVVGSVCVWGERVLLCRRAIEPRRGFWTLPAGYLELNESAEAGARREAWEEARARIAVDDLIGVYSLPHISQVQLIFRARLESDDVSPGPESETVRLFDWRDVPRRALAFPSVHWALDHYRQVKDRRDFAPFRGPPDNPAA